MDERLESQHVTWDIRRGEKFWVVFRSRDKTILGYFVSNADALRYAETSATLHGYTDYVVLEAIYTVRQASHPVPEVDVIPFEETK